MALIGNKSPRWKGDDITDGRFRKRARKLYQEHYGVTLPSDIVVHHIDLNFKNNDIDNLITMTRGDHVRLHRELRKRN